MRYLCLVYHEEKQLAAMTPEQMARLDAASLAHDRALDASGKLIAAQPLASVRTAKTVKRRNGRTLVTDGPFAETKEQLIGFVMVEARDEQEAIEIASNIPLAAIGQIEVRAICDIPGA